MSAAELLEQVKALPAREQRKFLLAVLEGGLFAAEDSAAARPRKATARVKWPDVAARAKRIFGARVLPNLVLLEREESGF